MKKIVILVVSVLFSVVSIAQQVKSHTVKSGETIYSICKNNEITQEQLQAANPSLNGVLRAGQIIQIPLIQQKRAVDTQVTFEEYKVKRKESLYGIAKSYGVTVDDILKYNAWAKEGIAKKDVLRIPRFSNVKQLPELGNNSVPDELGVKTTKHTVVSGETLYGISKKYNRSIDAILAENPKAASGLQVGMVLTFSELQGSSNVAPKETIATGTSSTSSQVAYKVKAGDTLYRVAKNYNVTVDELYQANSGLKESGLQTDMVIVIPSKIQKSTQVENWTVQPAEAKPSKEFQQKQYHIALLLPLSSAEFVHKIGGQSNAAFDLENDSTSEQSGVILESKISAKTKGFLQMYQGVILAVEDMRKQGMQVSVRLFDTEGALATVKNIVAHPDFKKADLIIGPIYPQVQQPVVDYSIANHIPMVSPLSSAGSFENSNPYYFKVNPTDKLIRQKTESFLEANFKQSNFLAVKVGGYGYLDQSAQFKQNFAHYTEYDAEKETVSSLKTKLKNMEEMYHVKSVAYIPFDEELKVSLGVNGLNTGSVNNPVTLVGQYNFTKFKSIQTEYLHALDLHVLSPYYVDYSLQNVNQFVERYRTEFYQEPTQFSFQGYDVATYFMGVIFNFGVNISSGVVGYQPDLLQGNFQFKKLSPSAGWLNEGLFLLEYKPDFTIYRKGKM
ncbi:MAG: LysM peptidoglycan-binding domain-containing protein [Mangrovibacterium sp.]